jgi:hypothetical protein
MTKGRRRRSKKERDAGGDLVMGESGANQWKTGPVSDMEGVTDMNGIAAAVAKSKKGAHLVSRQKKRRRAKGTAKALAVVDRVTGKSSSRLNRRELRNNAKQLW